MSIQTLQLQAEGVKHAVSSPSTCTSSTVTILNTLLHSNQAPEAVSGKLETRIKQTKSAPVSSKAKGRGTTSRAPSKTPKVAVLEIQDAQSPTLSTRELFSLATEVVNITMKGLNEAVKSPPQLRRQSSSKDAQIQRSNSVRRSLVRTSSDTTQPLQPRSGNHITNSPAKPSKLSRSSSSYNVESSGLLAMAECTRLGLSYMRIVQETKGSGIELPPLQLETGMSALIGKLIALGFEELAVKEIRILRKRLEAKGLDKETPQNTGRKRQDKPQEKEMLSSCLRFENINIGDAALTLIVATQMHIMKLIGLSKKPANIEAALEHLDVELQYSPANLLRRLSGNSPSQLRAARQLEVLSQTILSLCPSISISDDVEAINPKISISPSAAFRLQSIAFEIRLIWWKLSGHHGNLGKEILDPYGRCFGVFARRAVMDQKEKYYLALTSFNSLVTRFDSHGFPFNFTGNVADASKTPIFSIYKVLGSLAQEASLIEDAIRLVKESLSLLDGTTSSDTRRCSCLVRLATLMLRKAQSETLGVEDHKVLEQALGGITGNLRGDSGELDELLMDVSVLRRASLGYLTKEDQNSSNREQSRLKEICKSLVFTCVHFFTRYLGSPLPSDVETKATIKYEQRRKLVRKIALSTIEAVLSILKTAVSTDDISYDSADATLQDCFLLASRLETPSQPTSVPQKECPKNVGTVFVKISNVYWAYYLKQRKPSTDCVESQLLRCLRRSVESLSSRSQMEKEAGFLAVKLERLGGIYQSLGRLEEAKDILTDAIQGHIDNGVLKAAAIEAGEKPFPEVWHETSDIANLGRTLNCLIKIWFRGRGIPSGPPFDDAGISGAERGLLLEWELVSIVRILDTTADTAIFASAIRSISDILISIYTSDFPIRRARTCVVLLGLATNHPGLLGSDFVKKIEQQMTLMDFDRDLRNDKGLNHYQHHFKASTSVCLAFRQEQPDANILKSAVTVWLDLLDSCDSWASLTKNIDNTDLLLTQLQAIIDFWDMKGLEAFRIPPLRLLAKVREFKEPLDGDALIGSLSALGLQYLRLGYSGKAGLAFVKAQEYLEKVEVSAQTKLQWHLAYAEYLVDLGNIDKCRELLTAATAIAEKDGEIVKNLKSSATISGRVKLNRLIADASYVYSLLSFQRGSPNEALAHAKRCVKLNYRAWAGMESRDGKKSQIQGTSGSDTELESMVDGMSQMTISTVAAPPVMSTSHSALKGSNFWTLIMPLYRGLSQLSNLYAHQGLLQEAEYYTEQARKIVDAVQATSLISHNLAVSGYYLTRSGQVEKGQEALANAGSLRVPLQKSKDDVALRSYLGYLYRMQGSRSEELSVYGEAEKILETLMATAFINGLDKFSDTQSTLGDSMAKLTLDKAIPARKATSRSVRQTSTKATKGAMSKSSKPTTKPNSIAGSECSQLLKLKGNLIRQKAFTMMLQNKCELAYSLLSDAEALPASHHDIVLQRLGDAKHLVLRAMEEMSADAVFCVLQDSTISFPSIASTNKSTDRQVRDLSPGKSPRSTPPRKSPKKIASKAVSKLRLSSHGDFVETLRQARDHVSAVHTMAVQMCSTPVVHTISAVLGGIVMLLSAASSGKGKGSAHSLLATYSMEISKTVCLQRQKSAIEIEKLPSSREDLKWPTIDVGVSGRTFGVPDISTFQKEYIDIIPPTWTVMSISLSENKDELYISRLQSGMNPFILRLPLCRHNSRDADEEVFDFLQGRAELCEIIDLANFSTRDARDMTRSGAKAEWWAEREALDARMRDLLSNVENIWLGGFRGIFSKYPRQSELLARFRSSFQKILDKHLPSRQKPSKRSKTGRLNLDPRILELFIGLGNPEESKYDLDEPLTDLLYFVVDVLQFHGELNAYDEIDFDAIAVEVQDALRCYHETAHTESAKTSSSHTILILDKSLHIFPWESLPCLEGVSVSRMPSIECLRERILAQQKDAHPEKNDGYYIKKSNGAYVLNPSGDLKSTQAAFEDDLATLENWDSVIQREPTEAEMKSALESRELFLYFGHGSGAQYIRSRTIKKLDSCAVALLMGCSSGALTDAGELEPYGTPINYAHAGCPALLATLWDVTDKDIDRFSHAIFNRWGLFDRSKAMAPPKTPGKGKVRIGSKKREPLPPPSFVGEKTHMSLVEAVAKSRDACILRYLNGAAPVVYGVPVYLV